MFGKNKFKMDDLKDIKITSKMALKLSSISIAEGDLEKAQAIYDFFSKDMELPDTDPIIPSTFEQVKNTVGSVFGWVKNNQDDIIQVLNIVQSLRGKTTSATNVAGAASAASNIPPLPNE